jgi:hypothetical protein
MGITNLSIQEVAKRQCGVVSWPQLQALGVTRSQVWRRLRSGDWARELPGVWRLSWVEQSWMQKAWSASLWAGAGACLSHGAAARLWDLVETEADTIDVSAPYRLWTSASWLVPHKTAFLSRQVQRRKNGVAVTSPARALVDLAAVVDEDALQRAMESAFRRRIASVSEVRRVLRYLPASGRSGTGKAWRLLQQGAWSEDAQSELERRALQLFGRYRLPKPLCQFMVLEGDQSLGTVDFAWPSAKVIVEAEGFEFHSGRDAWDNDIARYNALVFHGWTVVRLTESDLRSRASSFAKALAKALTRH